MTQSFNLDATLYFPWVNFFKKSFLVPHFSVKDINSIDPIKLKKAGIKGLIFDKDNTLTAPYKYEIHPKVKEIFEKFREVYGNRIVIMSNSAGTKDDSEYKDATRIEDKLEIYVLRHDRKKPGGIDAVNNYFGVCLKDLAMFGDRVLTDVVFGNRYGMLTIHTAFLTEEGDNKTAAKIRKIEVPKMISLYKKGIRPPANPNFDPSVCLENLLTK